jgi:16S rRNA (adenine1518-N6/adenine1519-N6)-dimethyltransferase
MDIPPEAFSPRPKVHSRAILMTLRSDPPAVGRRALGRLTAAAFHARRKTVLNNLLGVYGREAAMEALSKLGVEPARRAETLAPEILAELAVLLEPEPLV